MNVDPLQQGAFISDVVNGVNRTVFRFSGNALPATAQGGLQFVNAGLMNPSSCSIEAYFSFDQVSGWRRIVDTRDRDRQGARLYDGALTPAEAMTAYQAAVTFQVPADSRAFDLPSCSLVAPARCWLRGADA